MSIEMLACARAKYGAERLEMRAGRARYTAQSFACLPRNSEPFDIYRRRGIRYVPQRRHEICPAKPDKKRPLRGMNCNFVA